jgi:tol-pal system protein YbgF
MALRVQDRPRIAASASLALAALFILPGCYSPQLLASRGGLDSLRVRVDTLMVRDSVAYELLSETRRELAAQRDVLLSTRASSGSSNSQLFDQMSRLEGKLDEVMGRFSRLEQRPPVSVGGSSTGGGPSGVPDPATLYDQAAQDLTQGRYSLARQEFRDVVQRYPAAAVTDNAQYGVGECFFAEARFDSASVEYARVEKDWPDGDKAPAAMYKLALCEEKLGHAAESRKALESLVKRFPLSGEAQLARERLGTNRRR